MSLRMANGLPERIVQVLRDFLPAELDLIDSEEGGTATPDVADADVHEWPRSLINSFPAITVNVLNTRNMATHSTSFGGEVHALHDVDIAAHVAVAGDNKDAPRLQTLIFRYASGIYRVLCVKKVMLETSGDPTTFAHDVAWRTMNYGPLSAQAGGTVTRSAVVGVEVRKVEVE